MSKNNKKPTLTKVLKNNPWKDVTDKIKWDQDGEGDYISKKKGTYNGIVENIGNGKLDFTSDWAFDRGGKILRFFEVVFMVYKNRLYAIEFKTRNDQIRFCAENKIIHNHEIESAKEMGII